MKDFIPAGRGPLAIKLAEVRPSDRVLNIGCFQGALERHFLKGRCAEFRGVDLNSEAIAFAKSFENDRDFFQIASAEALPFSDASFDVVFILDVLEHVENERATLSEIFRVLKPGGRLMLSVPHDYLNFLDPDDLTRELRNFVRKYIRKRPLLTHGKHRHYNEDELRTLLANFEIEKIHKSGTPLFWFLNMFYNGVGLPESFTLKLRRVLNPIENWDYRYARKTGFNIMIRARKPEQSH